MRGLICSIVCFFFFLPVYGQTNGSNQCLKIREAMDIVAYRRNHPLMDENEFDGFIKPMLRKYGYREGDFLEGIGTCSFWLYIKNGHVMQNPGPNDHDLFVPDNLQGASTVAVVDCEGIETIEYDETAISVEITVYAKNSYDEMMKEMLGIGFKYKRRNPDNDCQEYVYQSYTISVSSGSIRGKQYWYFEVQLNPQDYGSTKRYEFADSSRIHNLKISIDYPITGNPTLLRRVRTFMMEALELDLLNGWPMGRYSGDVSNGQSVVEYYGRKSVSALKEKHSGQTSPFKEETKIWKVAENDYYVSYEVYRYGWYGGVDNYRKYGVTYRKSDGKRLHVIANPNNPQFKQFLNNDLIFEKKDELLNEYKKNIPLPKYEPFLIQTGVRYIYQQYEIAPGAAGYVEGDSPFSDMWPFFSDETKNVIKGLSDCTDVKSMGDSPVSAIKFLESVYNDFFEPYNIERGNGAYLSKYFTKEAMRKFYVESDYNEDEFFYCTDFLVHGTITGNAQPDYGDKVVSRTIKPESDGWFLVTNIWDVIPQPVKIRLKVKPVDGAYKIVDICTENIDDNFELSVTNKNLSSDFFVGKIYKGNGNGGGLYTEMTISFLSNHQCICVSDWYQAYSSPISLKGIYEVKNNQVIVICKGKDGIVYRFEFDIQSNGSDIGFDHSDPKMEGTIGRNYMYLEIQK